MSVMMIADPDGTTALVDRLTAPFYPLESHDLRRAASPLLKLEAEHRHTDPHALVDLSAVTLPDDLPSVAGVVPWHVARAVCYRIHLLGINREEAEQRGDTYGTRSVKVGVFRIEDRTPGRVTVHVLLYDADFVNRTPDFPYDRAAPMAIIHADDLDDALEEARMVIEDEGWCELA